MDIKDLFSAKDKQQVTFIGRVRSNRAGKKVSFLVLNDGTTVDDAQVVYKSDIENYDAAFKTRVGSIVEVMGVIELTPNRPQPFEIQATNIIVLDEADEDYPLQKKEHSPEFLREIAQYRGRTKTFNAVFRIRSLAAFAIHKYFQENGYLYAMTPIITSNDAEGAGETFGVVTYDEKNKPTDSAFFNKKVSLTVSGQLHGEAMAQAFRKIYTFGPTFRAENSNTSRHASEFWMMEPEIAFADLNQDIEVMEDMLKSIFTYVLENGKAEMQFLDENVEKGLIDKITKLTTTKYAVVSYTDAIKLLADAVKEKKVSFENNDIKFGLDLGSEHEKYLCEQIYKGPTFVTNYPKEIKSFYMKQNDDGKTVAAVDLLVPGIGELCGGSEREGSYEKLMNRVAELKMDPTALDWYLDLRKYGYYKSAGFGLGFERLIMYLTGTTNIRDTQLFPRTPGNILF